MAVRESEKALRYLHYLDTARCNAQWDKIPELTRKVTKHAPDRKCLIITARTEAQVAEHIPPEPSSNLEQEEAFLAPPPNALTKLVAPLLAAIDEELTYPEDAFQATVCLGWIHWELKEYSLAAARMPAEVTTILARDDEDESPVPAPNWVNVCAMKWAYIKGFSLEKLHEKSSGSNQAFDIYKSVVPYLTSLPISLGSFCPEFRLWTERMLSRMVAVSMKFQPLGEWLDLESMLQVFHLWMSLFRFTPTNPKLPIAYEPPQRTPTLVELGLEVDYSRWDVWMAYYETLSEILRRGYIYSPDYTEGQPEILRSRDGLSDEEYLNVRLQQRTEIKKVETSIETKLLDETRFPKANERNSRVERWVDAVMVNWRIMCGPTWSDEELGEGGKNAIARGVLDILYRAATKSFHSTQILRYLFSVHAYLAEFDLAFKAFDSYTEIVQRGKDREEKSGEPDYSLDNDDTVLHTTSEAVRILCKFGNRKEAGKAHEICVKLEEWLAKAAHDAQNPPSDTTLPAKIPVSPKVISEAYRALGLCEAQWARLTYDAGARNGHQQQAVDHFRTALDPKYGNSGDLETKYSLAFMLAEMRELAPAIKIVKQTLSQKPLKADAFSTYMANGNSPEDIDPRDSLDYARERSLIPFWHLLSLLLTAKADLLTAVRSSNAAFEQFDDLSNLFGMEQEYRSEHLNETEKEGKSAPKALIDKMERYEKEGIIQVRITQIALMESMESPTEAIDASAELLALYARLFGDPKSDLLNAHRRMTTAKPPKSSVGTFRHSILGRAKSRHRAEKTLSMAPTLAPSIAPTMSSNNRPSTMATATTAAPTIQVTNEDGQAPRGRARTGHRHSLFRNKSHHGAETKRHSSGTSPRKLQKRSRSNSRNSPDSNRPRSAGTTTAVETDIAQEGIEARQFTPEQDPSIRDSVRGSVRESVLTVDRNSVLAETIREETYFPGKATNIPTNGSVRGSIHKDANSQVHSPPRPSTALSEKKAFAVNSRQSRGQSLRTRPVDEEPEPLPARTPEQDLSPRHSLRKICHNLPVDKLPSPAGQHDQPPKQDTRLPAPIPISGNPTPEPVFPTLQERRHKISLLIELWLFIAELYVRGTVFEDAKGAIDEAADLVQALETEIAIDSSSVRAFNATGWGGGKSVEDLWGDVHAMRGKLAASSDLPYEAMAHFERALSHCPDHPIAIVGLSELLLDIYCQKIAPEPLETPIFPTISPNTSFASRLGLRTSLKPRSRKSKSEADLESQSRSQSKDSKTTNTTTQVKEIALPSYAAANSPEELNRLAARDRAYGLLSGLTKLGSGWDYSEAWFALARAYEEGGQVEKAKEVLWWCVELEDTRPLRHWRNIRAGGFGVV
ncbi:hypothetical protein EJ08DRAFT_675842 [Tothia fuscella]|uniref:Filamentation protein n=1 Tax=Tothia fuscella TaxID=1048955 RepID=A0A9P4P0W2_9PEZI|nr:hypothetical protein EJ08DRAFT_675842 [Tothia fuscella]